MKIIFTSLILVSTLFAEIKIGEPFPVLNLVDQFDTKTKVKTKGANTLILSFEKDVSSAIKTYLNTKEKDFLIHKDIIYISEISSMPSFITKIFAIPKMKKFPFSISLIYDEKEGEKITRKEGKVTLITLNNNKIKSIKFVEAKDLVKIL